MKQLTLSYAPQPILIKATAQPRRKSIILLRRLRRRVALLFVGLCLLLCSPLMKGRKIS
ncbi:MAG: hypothetical protein U0Y68_25325 [Blastocatellia bacterium]